MNAEDMILHYDLPARLDGLGAEAVYQDLDAKIQGDCAVVLNGERVTRLDTPAVQLLLSLAQVQEKKQCIFRLLSPSPQMGETLARLGMAKHLEEWRNVDGTSSLSR